MAVRGTRKKQADKEPYHHGDLRRALLDASLALITEQGSGALSLREVARRAGVTHAAPYRHFADKEALLAEVAAEGFREMTTRMREAMALETEPLRALEACGVAYVLFAVERAAHFRVMFGPRTTPAPSPEDIPADMNSFRLLTRAILDGQQAGVVRQGEPLVLALTCWSLVHGLASLWVDGQLAPGGVEPLAREQTRLLLSGLARPGRD